MLEVLVVDRHFGRRRMRRIRKLTGCGVGYRGATIAELQPLDVKIANRVLFAKWSGTELKIDGEVVVAKESDIMGVVE